MKLSGKETFEFDLQTVWGGLHNAEILKNVIPGCQSLILKEDGQYDVELKLGIAAVKGAYKGEVKIEDIDTPYHYRLHAEGSGSPGHVKIQMDCKFSETESGCQLDWNCEADVGGTIARVGSRVLGGVANFMAGNFFKDLKKQLKHEA